VSTWRGRRRPADRPEGPRDLVQVGIRDAKLSECLGEAENIFHVGPARSDGVTNLLDHRLEGRRAQVIGVAGRGDPGDGSEGRPAPERLGRERDAVVAAVRWRPTRSAASDPVREGPQSMAGLGDIELDGARLAPQRQFGAGPFNRPVHSIRARFLAEQRKARAAMTVSLHLRARGQLSYSSSTCP